MRAALPPNVVGFGPFQLHTKTGELRRDGRKVRLQEQPFRVLKMLVEHPGEVLTMEGIRKTLWPNDTIVEFDNSIHAAIKKVRLALGDSADTHVTSRPSHVAATAGWYRWSGQRSSRGADKVRRERQVLGRKPWPGES
jgi:DNA-binding response OmpR family regulator